MNKLTTDKTVNPNKGCCSANQNEQTQKEPTEADEKKREKPSGSGCCCR